MSGLLTLTNNAVEAVKHVVSTTDAAPEGGLRVMAEPGPEHTNFEVSVAELPDEGDVVVEEAGARLFLEPAAALLLDDKVLDADVEAGRLTFTITDRAA